LFSRVHCVCFLVLPPERLHLINQVDRAVAFVNRNTRQGIRFTGRPEREIVPEYPTEAVREAITNAVCHRDYTSTGTVQVRIYDDRLEVWNPGTLPYGLTFEDLYREHISHPRNRLIAAAFFRARLIERWGTGTIRMIQECEAANLPQPEFLTITGAFVVRFRTAAVGVEAKTASALNDRQRRAIAYVREHRSIGRRQFADLFDVSPRQASRDLDALVDGRIFRREGKGAATRYLLQTEPRT
jgi:ATP-dependent DNA helicase RecG